MSVLTSAPVSIPSGSAPQPDIAEFRSRMGSIGRQSAVYFAGTILTTAAGYFFRVYLARTLGAEGLGLYTEGMSIVGFVALFSAFGLPTAAARFVAEYSALREYSRLGAFLRASLATLIPANLALGVGLLVAGPWIAIHFYHAPALKPYFAWFGLIMVFGSVTTFLGQAMAGYKDVGRRTLITHFIGTPSNIVFAVALISLGLGLTGYLVAQVASGFLVLLLLAVTVWKMTPPEARYSDARGFEKRIITFSAATFAVAIVEFVLGQADRIVLGHYLDAKQVGIYSVAMALVGFVPVALQSVNQIFAPNIAEMYASGSHALLQELYSSLTKWVVALTLPLALTIVFLSRPLLAIFGNAFEAGTAVLIIGTAGQLINCAVGSVGNLMFMSGHQNQMIKIQTVNAVLMIALSILLVPRIGIRGAAWAAAASVAVTNLWALASVSRRLGLFPYNASFLKLAFPCLISGALLQALRSYGHARSPWLLAGVALSCAYTSFLGSYALWGMDSKDRMLIRAGWSKMISRTQKIGANIG